MPTPCRCAPRFHAPKRYKILPGENSTNFLSNVYFHFTPSSFIIYQTKSTRFCVCKAQPGMTRTHFPRLSNGRLACVVLCVCYCFGFEVYFKNNKMYGVFVGLKIKLVRLSLFSPVRRHIILRTHWVLQI